MDKGKFVNPLVSVIMPAYNAQKYIIEAIESVVHQTYQNWELIVVDDCSSDKTKYMIETFINQDERIKPIYLDKNGGKPSIAKNYALKKAVGKYIAFLDSDDVWYPDKLNLQIELMYQNKTCGLCYTGGEWIDEAGKEIKNFMPKYPDGMIFKSMLKRYEINNQSVLVRTDLVKETGGFNPAIVIGEDYNLFMKILYHNNACSIKKPLIRYRIHENAITKAKKRVSDGVLVTLREMGLYRKYPFWSMLSYLKAVRFKYLKKRWN